MLLVSQWREPQLVGIDESRIDWGLCWRPLLELENSMDVEAIGEWERKLTPARTTSNHRLVQTPRFDGFP